MEAFNDEKWATERGVYFNTATTKDIEELKLFLLHNYYPDEIIGRILGTANGNSWVDKYARYLDYRDIMVDPIRHNMVSVPCSIVARSTVDSSIIGCRTGAIYDRKTKIKDSCVPDFLSDLPKWIRVPQKLLNYANYQALMRDLSYSKEDAFNDLQDSGDIIYIDGALCVSRTRRGEGLGAEMTKRAYKIALDAGCKYTYILATMNNSQRLAHKLGGAKVLHEVRYENYRVDKMGRPFLSDTGEHEVAQVIAVDHNSVVM